MRPAFAAVLFCVLLVLTGAVDEEDSLSSLTDNGLEATAMRARGNDLGEGKVMDSTTSGVDTKTWYRIPYFVLTHMSTFAGNVNEEACKTTCESKPECHSFSWKKSTQECRWSLDAIHFDPEFDFFAKTNPETGAPFTYYEFLGVKYQEGADSKKLTGVTSEGCRAKCDAEPTSCMSFSYRARDETCYLSGEGLHYDAAWTYYERDAASVPKDWKRGSTKEVAAKKSYRGTPTKLSTADVKNEEQKALKKATAAVAAADAQVATLKQKLAAAKDDAATASSSADKEVRKMQLQKTQEELLSAEKAQADAKLQMTTVEKQTGTKPNSAAQSAAEIDAAAKADAKEAKQTAKAAHEAAATAETTAVVSDSLMKAKEDAKAAQTAAKKAAQDQSSAVAQKDADAAKAAAAKAVEAAANAAKSLQSADPKARAKVASVVNAAEKAAEAAAAAAAAAEVKSDLARAMETLTSKKAQEQVAKRDHAALSNMLKVAQVGLQTVPNDEAIEAAEKRAANKAVFSEQKEKDATAQLAESEAKHAEAKQDDDLKQANSNENAAKLGTERASKKLSATEEESVKTKKKMAETKSPVEKRSLSKAMALLSDDLDKAKEGEMVSKEVVDKKYMAQVLTEKREGLFKKNVAESAAAKRKADEKLSKATAIAGKQMKSTSQPFQAPSEADEKAKAKKDADEASQAAKFRNDAIEEQKEVATKLQKAHEQLDGSEVNEKASASSADKARRYFQEMQEQSEQANKLQMSAILPGETQIADTQVATAKENEQRALNAKTAAESGERANKASYASADKSLTQIREKKATLDAKVSILTETNIEAEKKAKKEADEFILEQESEKSKKQSAADDAIKAEQHVLETTKRVDEQKIVLREGVAEEEAARKEMEVAQDDEEKIVKKVKQAKTMNDALAAGEILKEKRSKAKEAKLKWSVKDAVIVTAKKNLDKYTKELRIVTAFNDVEEQESEQLIKKTANDKQLEIAQEEAKAENKLSTAEEAMRREEREEGQADAAKLKLQRQKAKLAADVQNGEQQANELRNKVGDSSVELKLVRAQNQLENDGKKSELNTKHTSELKTKVDKDQKQVKNDKSAASAQANQEMQRKDKADHNVAKAEKSANEAQRVASIAKSKLTELRADYQDAYDMDHAAKKDLQRITVQERLDKAASSQKTTMEKQLQDATNAIKTNTKQEEAAKATVKLIEAKQAALKLVSDRATAKAAIVNTPGQSAEVAKEQQAAMAEATDLAYQLEKQKKKLETTTKMIDEANRDQDQARDALKTAVKQGQAVSFDKEEMKKAQKFVTQTTRHLDKSLKALEDQEKEEGIIVAREDRLAASAARAETKDKEAKMQADETRSKAAEKMNGDANQLNELERDQDRAKYAEENSAKASTQAKKRVAHFEKLVKKKAGMGLDKNLRIMEGKVATEAGQAARVAARAAEASIASQDAKNKAKELERKKGRDEDAVEADQEKMAEESATAEAQEEQQKASVKLSKEEVETVHKENQVKADTEKHLKDRVLRAKERTDKKVAAMEDETAADEALKVKAKMRAVESLRKAAVQKAVVEKMTEQMQEKRQALNEADRLVREATVALDKSRVQVNMQKTKVADLEAQLVKAKADSQIAKDASATSDRELQEATRHNEKAAADLKEADAAVAVVEKEGVRIKTALTLAESAVQTALSKCAFDQRERTDLGESASSTEADCPAADAAKKALTKAKADHAAYLDKLKEAEAAQKKYISSETHTKNEMRRAQDDKTAIMEKAGVVATSGGQLAETVKTQTAKAAEAKVAFAVDQKKHETAEKVLKKAEAVHAKAGAEKDKTHEMLMKAEIEQQHLAAEEELLAQKLQEKEDRVERSAKRAKEYEVRQTEIASQKYSDEISEKTHEAESAQAQLEYKITTQQSTLEELQQQIVLSTEDEEEAKAAFEKMNAAAPAMQSRSHLAHQEKADIQAKESRAKKEEAKTSVGLGTADTHFVRAEFEAKKAATVAELAKKRVNDLAVAKEVTEKKYAEVAGEQATAAAKEALDAAIASESKLAAELKDAQDGSLALDEKAMDARLKESQTKVETKKVAEKAKEAVSKWEESVEHLNDFDDKIRGASDEKDKLELTVEKAKTKKDIVDPLRATKDKLVEQAKAAEKNAMAEGQINMNVMAEQDIAKENAAKAMMGELSSKTKVKNLESEKDLKGQYKVDLDAMNAKVKEAKIKQQASLVLVDSAQELLLKKGTTNQAVQNADKKATEIDKKETKKIEELDAELAKLKKFEQDLGVASEIAQKKASTFQTQHDLANEAAGKLEKYQEDSMKQKEKTTELNLQEKTAKGKLKEAHEAAEKYKLASAVEEKKTKEKLARKLRVSAKFTEEIEQKLHKLSEKADESRSKREKTDDAYRENEVNTEKEGKAYHRAERQRNRLVADTKQKLQKFNEDKELAEKAYEKAGEVVSRSTMDEIDAKKAVGEGLTSERTSKEAMTTAQDAEKRSKTLSESRLSAIREATDKADKTRASDAERAQQLSDQANEKRDKVDNNEYVPADLKATVLKIESDLAKAQETLDLNQEELEKERAAMANAVDDVSKNNLGDRVKLAQERVNSQKGLVLKLKKEHADSNKKLNSAISTRRQEILTEIEEKKAQATAAAAEAETSAKESKTKAGRIQTEGALTESLVGEKTVKQTESTANLKLLEGRKGKVEISVQAAEAQKEKEEKNVRDKELAADSASKKYAASQEQATNAVQRAKQALEATKVITDQLTASRAQMAQKEGADRTARDKMAKSAEAALGKNNQVLDRLRELKVKDTERKTHELNEKVKAAARQKEEETTKEGMSKKQEGDSKLLAAEADKKTAIRKAQERAKKDLEAAQVKEVEDKKKATAENNMKQAVKMQFDAVEKAKMFRITLDEATSEKDIKTASMRLAGAKSVERKGKMIIKADGAELENLTDKERDLMEAKELADEALRASANQMKIAQENDAQLAEQQKDQAKESAEKEKSVEAAGKEQVTKNNQQKEENESKYQKQQELEKEKLAAQKEEAKQKVDARLAEEAEKQEKHDATQKELWGKGEARRAERAEKATTREKQEKVEENKQKEATSKEEEKHRELNTKETELQEFKREKQEKHREVVTKKDSEDERVKFLNKEMEELAAQAKDAKSTRDADVEAVKAAKSQYEEKGQKVTAAKGSVETAESKQAKLAKANGIISQRAEEEIPKFNELAAELFTKAKGADAAEAKAKSATENAVKKRAELKDEATKLTETIRTSESAAERTEAMKKEKDVKQAGSETKALEDEQTKEMDKQEGISKESQTKGGARLQEAEQSKAEKSQAAAQLVEEEKLVQEAKTKRSEATTAEFKVKSIARDKQKAADEAETTFVELDDKRLERNNKYTISTAKLKELSDKAAEKHKKHERAQKSDRESELAEKDKDKQENLEKAGEEKEKAAEQKAVESQMKEQEAARDAKRAAEKEEKDVRGGEQAEKANMKADEARLKAIAEEGGAGEGAEKAMMESEKIEKNMEKAAKDKESKVKEMQNQQEDMHKKAMEKAEESKDKVKKNVIDLTNKQKDAQTAVDTNKELLEKAKMREAQEVAKRDNLQAVVHELNMVSKKREEDLERAKKDAELHQKAAESADRKIKRAQKEMDDAKDDTSFQHAKELHKDAENTESESKTKETTSKTMVKEATAAKEKNVLDEREGKTHHKAASSDVQATRQTIVQLETEVSKSIADIKLAQEGKNEEEKKEVQVKSDIQTRQAEEQTQKTDMARRLAEMEAESKDKEGVAKKRAQEKERKSAEAKEKTAESTAKSVEKENKKNEAEKLAKEADKKKVWAEKAEKEKVMQEQNSKEREKKAECDAKRSQEQMQIRFTLAEDRSIEHGQGWTNFGNGYEGLRVQKQGNLCILSGLIRIGKEKIDRGQDAGRTFWHAEMETLIQTGESVWAGSANTDWACPDGQANAACALGVVGQQCFPETEVTLMANNHANTASVKINRNGIITWISGGSQHGWISLSGLVYKAVGTDGIVDAGNSLVQLESNNARVEQHQVVFVSGWKASGHVFAYKQGDTCFLLGRAIPGFSSAKFEGPILSLPKQCVPKQPMSFGFSRGEHTFRMVLGTDGQLYFGEGQVIPDGVKKEISNGAGIELASVLFSTSSQQKAIALHTDKGWVAKQGQEPQAVRQGSMCILSGVATNAEIRSGAHSLLQNSGSPGQLPEWCLPRERLVFTTIGLNGRPMRIDIQATGAIRWIAGQRDKEVNLSGIRFEVRADIVQKYSGELLKVSECVA